MQFLSNLLRQLVLDEVGVNSVSEWNHLAACLVSRCMCGGGGGVSSVRSRRNYNGLIPLNKFVPLGYSIQLFLFADFLLVHPHIFNSKWCHCMEKYYGKKCLHEPFILGFKSNITRLKKGCKKIKEISSHSQDSLLIRIFIQSDIQNVSI